MAVEHRRNPRSIGADRQIKGRIYATAAIREYWLLNLINPRLEVYRDTAEVDGVFCYRDQLILRVGDSIRILAFPDAKISVDEVMA